MRKSRISSKHLVLLVFSVGPRLVCSAVQRAGVHQPVPFLGEQWRLRLGGDAGNRALQQQDVTA